MRGRGRPAAGGQRGPVLQKKWDVFAFRLLTVLLVRGNLS